MTARLESREAAILLPLTAGLLQVALANALPGRAATVALSVVVMLAVGAVLPERPWRSGAIAAVPGLAVGLARAADGSLGVVALTVASAPVAIVISALLVKGGALLGARSEAERHGDRWRPFETKAQRGRFLVIVAVAAVLGSSWLTNGGGEGADRAADRRAGEIRAALEGRSFESLRRDWLAGAYGGSGDVPGGPFVFSAFDADRFRAHAQVKERLQYRCIHVEVARTGEVSTRIERGRCR